MLQKEAHIKDFPNTDIEFWKNPGGGNEPLDYWNKDARSEFLLGFIDGVIPKNKRIVEFGCNSGRNLKYLIDNGYLAFGFDVNEKAVEFALEKGLPVHISEIENFVLRGKMPPIILCMAVLEHIPYNNDWIFDKMDSEFLIIIEDEVSNTNVHHPRKYKEIFEKLGYKELKHETIKGDLFCCTFEARIFGNRI